jgi:hypothetical protein
LGVPLRQDDSVGLFIDKPRAAVGDVEWIAGAGFFEALAIGAGVDETHCAIGRFVSALTGFVCAHTCCEPTANRRRKAGSASGNTS